MTEHRRERDVFIAAASDFCRLYEDTRELRSERFLLGLAGALPHLQAAAVELPYSDDEIPADDLDVDLTTEEMDVLAASVAEVLREIDWDRIRDDLPESSPERTADEAIEMIEQVRESLPESMVEETDWDQIRANLREYLAETRSPHRPAPLPIDLFLYDDLHDIYRDLKEGFRLIDAGRPEAEAVFYWRLNFWGHWGYHNADALRVIHYCVALYLAG